MPTFDLPILARISDADPEMLRYFADVGIVLDSRVRVLTRREFAGMISVAIESDDGAQSTVRRCLGVPVDGKRIRLVKGLFEETVVFGPGEQIALVGLRDDCASFDELHERALATFGSGAQSGAGAAVDC